MLAMLRNWFDLTHDQDESHVIDRGIRAGARIGGTNLWVLFFAILIASVGLNVNSTAVIIGAMLISPLMGPLLAMGYGAGISDGDLIRKAVRGLGIFVGLSLLTSTAYFWLSPLSEAHTELLARTTPTLWDVLIAFFGGCAGIVAHTRKDESTIIPGAAIATALMPPLCTVGYGIAAGNWQFAAGAAYLFLINAFFIALATFLFVRLLGLPKHKDADPQRQRRAHLVIGMGVLALALPSAYLAYGLVQDQIFLASSRGVVAEVARQPGVILIAKEVSLPDRTLSMVLAGDPLGAAVEQHLQGQLQAKGFVRARLVLRQLGQSKVDIDALRAQLRSEMADTRLSAAPAPDPALAALRQQLAAGEQFKAALGDLARELMAQYPAIVSVSLADASRAARAAPDQAPQMTATLLLAIDADPALGEADLARIRAGLGVRFPERTPDVIQAAKPAVAAPVRKGARRARPR